MAPCFYEMRLKDLKMTMLRKTPPAPMPLKQSKDPMAQIHHRQSTQASELAKMLSEKQIANSKLKFKY